jgi:hypothetical protein
MKKLLFGSMVFFFVLYHSSCKSEPEQNYDSLIGKWELETATNNGKPTELLTGLFFNFSDDGSLRTNVTGSPESVTYEVDNGIIEQREGRIDVDYTIETLNDTLLILSANIRNAVFRFNLNKVMEGEGE